MSRDDGHKAGRERAAGAQATLRTCAVSRAQLAPEDMIRFVMAPDGSIVPDVARRLPGRGIWVTCDKKAVAGAVKSKAFARSLRRQVKVADDLAEVADQLLARRALEALSLANKAGLVITGFAKVEAAAGRGDAAALVHGSDAAADGMRKLDRLFTAICRELEREPVIVRVFTSAQLSLAMGRPNVVHAALERGGAATKFLNEAARLARFRFGPTAADRASPGTAGPASSQVDTGTG